MSDVEYLTVLQDIPANGGTVYAYRAGDRITQDAVDQNGWQDYVSMPNPPKTASTAATTKEK